MLRMGFNGLHVIFCVTVICLVMDVRSELTLQAVYSTLNERLDDLSSQTFSHIKMINTRIDNIEESISKSGQQNKDNCEHESTDSKEIDNSKFTILKAFESEKKLILRVLEDYNYKLAKTNAVLNGQMEQIKKHIDNSVNQVDLKFKRYETRANESIDQFRKDSDAHIQIVSKQLKTLEDQYGEDHRKSFRAIRRIQGSITKLTGNISQVHQLMANIKDDSENNFGDLRSELAVLERNYDRRILSTLTTIQGSIHDIEKSTENLSDRTDGIEGSINLLKDKPHIGFTAYLSKLQSDVPGSTTLVFDSLYSNYKNVYNSNTGIFTAPKTGLYLFYFNIRSCNIGTSHVLLYVDGRVRNSAVANTGPSSSGSAAIAHMTVGDKAYIKTASRGGFCFKSFRTSFTGVLIS